ncbi:MarR family winged helix-turn-helix transcriptional regulator [Piscinibacter sakaiensis]|uniref:Transcriptional regulator, MarR family n=1 Tax=Piscinibacter sakaiensis TaxID=1547922 RepID=A0A0K8P4R4_PISS1|nr:MarR family winged helix-turn-helix transcriptional regulator [Piscinibacter sakaiensis]GAP37611.1 transcriptional regulator, MarR family [Piscinibacter sakaiensis]
MSVATAPPPADLEDHLGFWLRRVSNHVSQGFQQRLAAEGVSVAEWVALRTLLARPGCRQGDLIEALGITKGAASKLVTRLEGKGLAERLAPDAAGREQRLALTAAGRARVPALAAQADANDARFFGHLPDAERAALLATLQALAAHHGMATLPTE